MANNWRGCKDIKMIWHGEWNDPELVTEYDGVEYWFNYYDIENALWEDFLESEGIEEKDTYDENGNISDEYENEFSKYCQDNAYTYLIWDVIPELPEENFTVDGKFYFWDKNDTDAYNSYFEDDEDDEEYDVDESCGKKTKKKNKSKIVESAGSSNVKISANDYDTLYTDISGVFGEPGVTISLGEMKEYWNEEKDNDPVLSDYDSYDEWWADTEQNLEPADNRFASGKYTLKVDTSGPEDHFSAPVGAEFGLRGKTICPFNKEGQEWIELCLDRRIPIGQDSLVDDDELDVLFCDPNSGEVSDEIIEYLYDFEPLQESLGKGKKMLKEGIDTYDLNSAVYNALTDVCFEFMNKGNHPTEEEMNIAIEWWQTHFWDSDDAPED